MSSKVENANPSSIPPSFANPVLIGIAMNWCWNRIFFQCGRTSLHQQPSDELSDEVVPHGTEFCITRKNNYERTIFGERPIIHRFFYKSKIITSLIINKFISSSLLLIYSIITRWNLIPCIVLMYQKLALCRSQLHHYTFILFFFFILKDAFY